MVPTEPAGGGQANILHPCSTAAQPQPNVCLRLGQQPPRETCSEGPSSEQHSLLPTELSSTEPLGVGKADQRVSS